MGEYTKGDWKIQDYGKAGLIIHKTTNVIAIVKSNKCPEDGYIHYNPQIAEANAHLIAAAPRMYEALKEHYLIPNCGGDFCFLATEGMENECPEPDEGAGNCKYREQCRAMNAWMIKRDKALAKANNQ